ncbi:MAG TPA: adenylate/guanylate cyclase domain-containing protein [Gaiellaceae bacterium]|nr:adenylate/guanylate cyclase domain-containing protein [Gaiellaceae bacterium]
MADVVAKSFDRPDNVVEFPKMRARIVELGDLTVGELISEPGWRWSEHVRPRVGGDWCQARHVGFIVSGRLGIDFMDGSKAVFEPGDVFDVPPGHDGYTVGDEECVQVEWMGLQAWAGFPTGIHSRVLATLLFTDLVDSTALAAELGDARWRALLSELFQASRNELERFGGREANTTGDGMLATFDGPARALHCAGALLRCAERHGVQIRVGVHVGEVELVGSDVRGIAVHEAARVMSAAGPGEIFVSELTRALAGAAGLRFEDRGLHALKGLDGEWRLAAYLPE